MKKFIELGLLDETERSDLDRYSYREFLSDLIKSTDDNKLEEDLSVRLQVDKDSTVMKRLEWLGFFSDEPLPPQQNSAFDVLLTRMQEKLSYEDDERDMIVLEVEVTAEYPVEHLKKKITMTLIDYGIPDGDSAIARTVGLPAAIATKLIVQEKVDLNGIRLPTEPVVYKPVLEELKKQGIIIQGKEEIVTT